MSKAAVIYWSQTGNTEQMATAIAEGIREGGMECDLLSVADTNAGAAAGYDKIALGCPAMGAEVLEEAEFDPFFTELENRLAGRKVALFGSYGWGGGEWMRTWESDCAAAGITLCAESVICQDKPDDAALAACAALGEALK